MVEQPCPRTSSASYPPAVAAPPRSRKDPRSAGAGRRPAGRPADDLGVRHGPTHDLLASAVEEAARLLDADGAMVYLVDPATGRLRFAHDAGIKSPRSRAWVRAIELEPGTGMFGRAVAERAVVLTRDYPNDPAFRHAPDADRVVADIGIRSMVVAPLSHGAEVLGALGTFSAREDAFDPAQIALVRSLADHAAAAIANSRLIDELDRSTAALAERADVERALREITARISSAADLSSVLQRAVDEAARLLHADGARIDLIDPKSGLLRWAYASGALQPDDEVWPDDPDETLDQGISGQAVVSGRAFWTGDYANDTRFPHGAGADSYIEVTGIHSVMAAPLSGEAGAFGALTVFTDARDAWAESDATILESIAAQAAIAITRARLIEELDRSRGKLARRAQAEQALREIAARITALRDQAEILQEVIELASRLVGGQGAILDLLDPASGNLRWAYDDGLSRHFTEEERGQLWISVGVGATGAAVAEDRVVIAGDELASLFPPSPESTEFYERTGFHSMIAAPITGDDGPLGVIEVYAVERDAFDESDGDLIRALAGQAAIAITNARLITELASSRTALARTAEAERTLREIAARVSAILDPTDVLERIVTEAARLLASDGARIDIWDEELGALRWAYSAGEAMQEVPEWGRSGGLRPRQAVAGLAFAEQRPVMTTDYLTDERFDTTPAIEAFVRNAGIRAVISTPLAGEHGPLGVLSVVSRQPGAYSDQDVETLTALANHASIAITNANLMDQLARSRHDIQRRAEAERALREIGAAITTIRQPGDVLQRVVDEAVRLLRGDGAVIDQFDPDSETLHWAFDSGISEAQREGVKLTNLRLGEGVSGKAVAEGRVITVGDYMAAEFQHDELADSLATGEGLRDLIVAPIIGDAGPLGAIEVFSRRPYAFDALDAAILGGLAEQSAIAITNARLIDELERSQAALARRAETERSLRDITARIAALHDPDEVLERVVEDAKRLLDTDGAHLTRMAESGTYLVPVVVAGAADDVTRDWLLGMEFPLGGGINGLAAEQGLPVTTFDYLADPRIPHEPDDLAVARRLGLRGMAATPLRAPGGEVIGTLAVSSAEPRLFEADELDLLGGLADQAAIALTNSNLLLRLTREEARFRGLVQTTPDVIWRADTEGRFTFMADSATTLFGWPVDEIIGQPFELLTDPASMPLAIEKYLAVGRTPDLVERVPLTLLRRDGSTFAAEVTTTGVFEDGRWVGAQGTVRDVSERERLERELRQSEERYRYLVQNAPDLVWSIGADARLTFLSDACERLTGFAPGELIGRHFGAIVHPSSADVAEIDWTQAMQAPSQELRGRLNLLHRDGSAVPAEFIAVATLGPGGEFIGANGSVRDMRERDRLEAELRQSEERYRFLVDNSPDIVFAIDPDGRFTYVSESIRRALGRDPGELLGQSFAAVIHYDHDGQRGQLFEAMRANPDLELTSRMRLIHADGRRIPFEVSSIGVRVDGVFAGIHGAARDIGERERLEQDLRESEARYRTLASSSPDMVFATDPAGRYTFLSDRAQSMFGWQLETTLGRDFLEFVAPGWEGSARESYGRLMEDPEHVHTSRLDFLRHDGTPIPLEINVVGSMAGGELRAIHGVARDISERERFQAELRRQAGELAAGEERAHLARELHDSVTQALFSMTMVTRSVELLLDRDPAGAREQLVQLRDLQREALAEMRALIFELRPGNLEQDGLVRALKTHTSALQGRLGLPIVVESDLPGRLPLAAEEALYRIAQEALHNTVKHAKAKQVRVRLDGHDGGVRLRIQDDGLGFDPTRIPDGHLGLAGMRARADRIGATFVCTSRSGQGTTIEVTLDAAGLAVLAAAAEADGRSMRPDPSPSIRDG